MTRRLDGVRDVLREAGLHAGAGARTPEGRTDAARVPGRALRYARAGLRRVRARPGDRVRAPRAPDRRDRVRVRLDADAQAGPEPRRDPAGAGDGLPGGARGAGHAAAEPLGGPAPGPQIGRAHV